MCYSMLMFSDGQKEHRFIILYQLQPVVVQLQEKRRKRKRRQGGREGGVWRRGEGKVDRRGREEGRMEGEKEGGNRECRREQSMRGKGHTHAAGNQHNVTTCTLKNKYLILYYYMKTLRPT